MAAEPGGKAQVRLHRQRAHGRPDHQRCHRPHARPARGRGRRPGRSIRRAQAPGPSIRPARRRSPARGGSANAGRLNWSWPAMKVTLTVRRDHRAGSSARSRPTDDDQTHPDAGDDDRIRRPAGDAAGRSSVTAAIMLPVPGGGPHRHGRSASPGPARTAPPVLLGRRVIGVGLDEQLYEHRVHDVPPGPAAASLVAGRCC